MRPTRIRQVIVTLGMAMVVGCPGLAHAGPRAAKDGLRLPHWLRQRIKTREDRQEIHALDLILTLGLTRAQAQALLPIYEDACRLHVRAYEAKAALQPAMVEAYSAFLAEDRLNQGFTPEIEGQTAWLHRLEIEAHDRFGAEMQALEAQAAEALSSQQQQLAAQYRPGHQALAEALARRDGTWDYGDQPRRHDLGWLHALMHGRTHRHDGEAIRHVSADRKPAERPTSVDQALTRLKGELKEVHRAIHPRPDVLGRHLLTPAAATPLYKRAGLPQSNDVALAAEVWRHGLKAYPAERCRKDEQTLNRIRTEINNWNLVNGLHLSRDQLRGLMGLIDRWEQVDAFEHDPARRGRATREQIRRERLRLEAEADATLNPGQREVLAEYKPCLLPPKNLKNPVRVGQARDTSHLARWLERMRSLPEEGLEAAIEKAIARQEDHLGPLPGSQRTARRSLLAEVVAEVRAMSDVDFELSKGELIARIEPEDQRQVLAGQIEVLQRKKGLTGTTARFLLQPHMKPVLRLRYDQLGRQGSGRRADLARAQGGGGSCSGGSAND